MPDLFSLYIKAVVKNTFSYYHCIVYSVRASNKTLPSAEIIYEITQVYKFFFGQHIILHYFSEIREYTSHIQ